jgi:alkylated DNA repair dioxygenase AlkB
VSAADACGRGSWDLFGGPRLPDGFRYLEAFLSVDEERELLGVIARVEFSQVEMRGGIARRRTAHYGWTYGYTARQTDPGPPIPEFLLAVRARAARWAELDPESLAEALITEYPPGAPIGWHRDAPMFGDVIGISLASACRMKFRPYVSPQDLTGRARSPRRTTHALDLAPRSIYLMRGIVRRDFEHSIPPVERLRYSITFRTMRRGRGGDGQA